MKVLASFAAATGRLVSGIAAVSLGALPLAHLLFWASRASVLGPSPRIDWIGPASRRPDPATHQFGLEAMAAAHFDGQPREARAVALVRR